MKTPLPLTAELASQLHPTLNTHVDVTKISGGLPKKVWWVCELGHEWEQSPNSRSKGRGCPYCGNKKVVAGFNDLATTNPMLAAQWHPTLNGDLTPQSVVLNYSKPVWWVCDLRHEWEATPNRRAKQKTKGCAVCAGQKVLAGFNDLATTHPELAAEWHLTLNTKTPTQVSKGNIDKIWWQCALGHEWQATVNNRTSSGSGCLVCSNRATLVGYNDLATTHPELAAEWHPTLNGSLKPTEVIAGSASKFWWKCALGHEWKTTPSSRTLNNRACAVCANQKTLVGYNDLNSQSPLIASQWHPILNGSITPEDVVNTSNKKAWWLCANGHAWETQIQARTNLTRATGCPNCSYSISKAEQNIFEFVSLFDFKAIQSDRKILKGKELDIYLPEESIAIEFNGLYWHTEEAGKSNTYHYDKWIECKQQGIKLIQIWEDDWNRNPDLVKRMLARKLEVSIETKILARNTKVIELNLEEAKTFLSLNDIKGFSKGSHYLGLATSSENTIVAVMALSHERFNINILRYATSHEVVGGFNKLLKHAELIYQPKRFTVYSDNAFSEEPLYENAGFTIEKEIAPDYMYVVNGERKPKETCKPLKEQNTLPRIWDAGKTKWKKDIN